MSKQIAEHHKKAAEHHESAAHHNKQAVMHHEAGSYEKAAYHARLAHEHYVRATYHASKDTSSWRGAAGQVKSMKHGRGLTPCRSCDKNFLKTQLTSRGQCLSCAQANKPHKRG
jgi:HEPN domain-containing protein